MISIQTFACSVNYFKCEISKINVYLKKNYSQVRFYQNEFIIVLVDYPNLDGFFNFNFIEYYYIYKKI